MCVYTTPIYKKIIHSLNILAGKINKIVGLLLNIKKSTIVVLQQIKKTN